MMLQPALRGAGCSACRSSLVRLPVSSRLLFAAAGGGGASSSRNQRSFLGPRARQLSSFDAPKEHPKQHEATANRQEHQEGDASVAEHDGPQQEAVVAAPVLPWYLQVEPPRHPTLVREESPLPDVPEGSPRLVQPLLQFASDDLGLDELNLMDLRSLDPPPALGPQLLMLFGTARSERHLHVSAGRLVTWLRGRGIHANADGLLGRNELKIKLRRKARRAKLLGNTAAASADDGITTSWICVNVGTIGWTAQETAIVGEDGTMSGFGSPQTGTTVVVQIFTEAKRRELDLETLWSRLLARSVSGNAPGAKPEVAKPEVVKPPLDPVTAALSGALPSASPGKRNTSQAGQQRFFSSLASRPAASGDLGSWATTEFLNPAEFEELCRTWGKRLASDGREKVFILERLREHIAGVSKHRASEVLRRDRSSPFLSLCSLSMRSLPPSTTWELRAWLYAKALSVGSEGYSLAGLGDLIAEMKLSGITASRELFMLLLRAIFCSMAADGAAVQEHAKLSLEVFDTMYERGEPTLTADTIVTVITAIAESGARGPEVERVQAAFGDLIGQAGLPCLDETHMVQLMEAYASQEDWVRFWEVWRIPPKFLQPRSPNLYMYMYRRLAATKHQKRCIDGIRACFQEMMNERPPVQPEGEVLEALKACIRVADPQAEQMAHQLAITDAGNREQSRREFVALWRSLVVGAI